MRTRSDAGFTLLEIMIVVGILGVVSGSYVLNAQSGLSETRATICEKNRTVYEDEEQLFYHREGRSSMCLQELVDRKYLNKVSCPRGGILSWSVIDPGWNYPHQALVCSIHGQRSRIRVWKLAVPGPASDKFAIDYGFEEEVPAGWSEVKGKYWEVVNGKYQAGLPGGSGGEHRSFSGSEDWTDYTLTLTASLEMGQGYGVYFRVTDVEQVDGYVFQYDPGYSRGAFLFREIVNGREKSPFARAWAPSGYSWYGQDRSVSIAVAGDSFKAYLDGVEVLSGNDSTWSAGGVGLRTWARSVANFDDIRVELNE